MMTSLYRHFDRDGRLLYVGISKNAVARLNGHKGKASWYADIRNVTIANYPSRDAALRAEARAIRTESPAHNVQRPAPKPIPDRLSEVIGPVAGKKIEHKRGMIHGPFRPRVLGYVAATLDDAEPIILKMLGMGASRDLLFLDDPDDQSGGLAGLMKAAQHEGAKVLTFPCIPDDCRDLLKRRGVSVRAVA